MEELEEQLGLSLPRSFGDALLMTSRSVDFTWFVPDDLTFDPPFDGIFSGCLTWSLESTLASETNRRSWVAEVFPDPVACVPERAAPDAQGRRGFRIGCTVDGPVVPYGSISPSRPSPNSVSSANG